jgi:protein-tyrosine phosphatase
MYNFSAAAPNESIVFGAARPGYKDRQVSQWIDFVKQEKIQQVCCLLTREKLERYSNLLATYQQEFGEDRVCWAPIQDFQLCELQPLAEQILPFLAKANFHERRVVIHCGGGIGRTGQILAAWLVYKHHYSNRDAILTMINTGRNPYEAAIFGLLSGQNVWHSLDKLNLLLDNCRSIAPK